MTETSNMISHHAYLCEALDTVHTAYKCRQQCVPASITKIPLSTILPTVVSWINDARTYIERSTDSPRHRPLEQRLDKMGCLGCGESFAVALETCIVSYRDRPRSLEAPVGCLAAVPSPYCTPLSLSYIEPLHLHLPCSLLYTQAWVAKHIATWRLRLQARRTRNWPSGQSASRSHTSIAIASVSSPIMGSTESKACWPSYTMVISLVKITSSSPCGMLLT